MGFSDIINLTQKVIAFVRESDIEGEHCKYLKE